MSTEKRHNVHCLFCSTPMSSIEPVMRWVCWKCNADLSVEYSEEKKLLSIKVEDIYE